MTGRYTKIRAKFWSDEKVKKWDDDTKLLALYLLTSPHKNLLGLFVLNKLYICADLGWDTKRLGKPFAKLLQDGFIKYDEESELLLLVNFMKHNPLENGNQVKAAISLLRELPKSPLWQDLKQLLEPFAKPFAEPLLERLGNPVTVTVNSNSNSNSIYNMSAFSENENPDEKEAVEEENENSKPESKKDYTHAFELFWDNYPRKIEKKRAYSVWKTRVKNKADPQEMITAAINYANYCRSERTEERFIKHAGTFLSDKEDYKDWISTGKEDDKYEPYTGSDDRQYAPYTG